MKALILILLSLSLIKHAHAYDARATEALQELLTNAVQDDRDKKPLDEKAFFGEILYLMERGANPNIQNKLNFSTAIHFAIQYRNFTVMRRYFETGGHPDFSHELVFLPLEMAIGQLDVEEMRYLLAFGANIHAAARFRRNSTVVHYANLRLYDEKAALDLMKKYVCRGSKPALSNESFFTTKNGDVVFELARALTMHDDDKVVAILDKYGDSGQNPIHTAIALCIDPDLHVHMNLLPALFRHFRKHKNLSSKINALDDEGRTPLLLALVKRKNADARTLVENGAKILFPEGPNLLYLVHVVPGFHFPALLEDLSLADALYKETALHYYLLLISAKDIGLPHEIIIAIAWHMPHLIKQKPFSSPRLGRKS